ncbi:MAG TPA: ACT domain-containing protein [Chitinophagaceae bacterium]|nr:ACT domain-containing protein [Chitinophagaceae bacterium]
MKEQFIIQINAGSDPTTLNRLASLFTRRRIPIDSLQAISISPDKRQRFLITVRENIDTIQKLSKQIEKQVDVMDVSLFIQTQ